MMPQHQATNLVLGVMSDKETELIGRADAVIDEARGLIAHARGLRAAERFIPITVDVLPIDWFARNISEAAKDILARR
jgi:hypothetical protein